MTAVFDVPQMATDTLRVPPNSEVAEQSVLGSILLHNGAFDAVADLLSDSDFYRHGHKLIYAAISDLVLACRPADVVTIFERLKDIGKADEVGGLAYLNALANCVPGPGNARRYAKLVREKAVRRALIAAADNAATEAYGAAPVSEVLDRAAAALGALERHQHRKEPRLLADSLAAALDRYNAIAEGMASAGWQTGIGPLDDLLGGLKRGKLYGLAARPSVGKSSAARTIVLRLAKDGHPVLLLSQEMGRDELTDCYVAELGGIDSARLGRGDLADDDWARLADAIDAGRDLPLWIDDEGGLTLADIRAKARAVKGLQCLVLDYLQLSRSTLGRGSSTNDQIAELSRGLKALAMEMEIPIIVLSQLNRDVEKRVDKEPQLADLRDSGAIEQDLDVCVMLWTVIDESSRDNRRLVGWKVAKHRGGPKGRFGMRWLAASNQWMPSDESIDRKVQVTTSGGFE